MRISVEFQNDTGAPEERRRQSREVSVIPEEFGLPAAPLIPPTCTTSQPSILKRLESGLSMSGLILEDHAFEVTALELLAGEFSCLLVQTGKACPVEHLVTSLHAFRERVGRSKRSTSIELRFT